MTRQVIQIGTAPTGSDGDTARAAFTKVNSMTGELYTSAALADSAVQPGDLTAYATAAQGALADSAVQKVELYSAGGSAVNAKALNGLTGAADRIPYFTGVGALSLATLTDQARALLDDATPLAMRSTLELVKQTSATDTTAGSVLLFGAHGLGSTGLAIPSGDYNLAISPGFYKAPGATAVNGPEGIAVYGVLQVYKRDSNVLIQEATYAASKWFRSSADAGVTWLLWQKVFHTNNILGTVSQSGGVPTGAIIESGSNANGKYEKYANGALICTHTLAGGTAVTSSYAIQGITIYRQRTVWTFPAAFIAAPALGYIQGQDADDTFQAAKYRANSTTGVSLDSTSFTSFASFSNLSPYVSAVGRWF